jgi:hypothetical protein
MCVSLEGQRCTLMDDGPFFFCAVGLSCVSSFGPLEGVCREDGNKIHG